MLKRALETCFVISAEAPDGLAKQTRLRAGSAMMLAQARPERGFSGVTITDGEGVAFDVAAFRFRYLMPSGRTLLDTV